MKEQLTDCTSELYNILQNLTNEAKRLKEVANRIEKLNESLVYNIQEERITDMRQVYLTITLFEDALPINEIIQAVIKINERFENAD